MANCYLCGRPIEDTRYHLRRRVRTGDFERRQYSGRRVSAVQTHYGMRVVCTRCATMLDRRAYRLWIEGYVKVLVALIVLLIALLTLR